MQLLDIENGNESDIDKIQVTTEYMATVEKRLNSSVKKTNEMNYLNSDSLTKDNKELLISARLWRLGRTTIFAR